MLSDIWRGMVALADWRGWLRIAAGRPEVDVVFITNLRDEADRRRFFGRKVSVKGQTPRKISSFSSFVPTGKTEIPDPLAGDP